MDVESLLLGLVELSLHYSQVADIIGKTGYSVMGDRERLLKCPVLQLAFTGVLLTSRKNLQYFSIMSRCEALNLRFIAGLILLASNVKLFGLLSEKLLGFHQFLPQGSGVSSVWS